MECLSQRVSVVRPSRNSAIHHDIGKSLIRDDLKCTFFSGYGEISGVRGVIQRVVRHDVNSQVRMDEVEILYTDSEAYVPLLHEFLTEAIAVNEHATLASTLGLPITFAEGIATIYSRPGRALRAWLRWIHADGLQSKAVQLIREDVLNRPLVDGTSDSQQIGYARLASNLRRISIGFGMDRYVPTVQSVIKDAKDKQQEFLCSLH